jgi:hypothetical protein
MNVRMCAICKMQTHQCDVRMRSAQACALECTSKHLVYSYTYVCYMYISRHTGCTDFILLLAYIQSYGIRAYDAM